MSGTPHRGLNKEEVDWFFRETDVLNMQYSQLMAMVTWAKKKFKQICQYRAKGTYCGYMGDYKKIKKQHSFRR